MRECMDADAVVARLKRIEGQVRGIMNMVQKDVPCEDIPVQIGAAKSALHKTGQVILKGHLHHCVRSGIAAGNSDETLNKLVDMTPRTARVLRGGSETVIPAT